MYHNIPLNVIAYPDSFGVHQISDAEIIDAVGVANDNFRRNNINVRFFIKCGIIRSTCISCGNEPNPTTLGTMFLNGQGSHYTLHIINNGTSQAVLPWAPFAGNIVIGGRFRLGNGTTLTHELGHALGLLHTHRGRNFGQTIPHYGMFFDEFDNHESGTCYQESVSRTLTQGIGCVSTIGRLKCEVNGDELCDTPASPDLRPMLDRVNFNNCTYTWNGRDNWNALYQPLVNNYMGYAIACRTSFTAGQKGRLLSYVPSFTSNVNSFNLQLSSPSGNNLICPGTQITLTVPSNISSDFFAWHIPPGWTIVSSNFTIFSDLGDNGWRVARGNSAARSITLLAPSSGQISATTTYNIGVNHSSCGNTTGEINITVNKLTILSNSSVVCTNSIVQIFSNQPSNFQLSNPSWQIISGQGSQFLSISVGTGACTVTATSSCGSQPPQVFSLFLEADTNCEPGGPILTSTLVDYYYPNPSNGRIFVQLGSISDYSISIFENEKQLLTDTVLDTDFLVIELPEKNSTYLVKIFSKNGKQETLRIVKN